MTDLRRVVPFRITIVQNEIVDAGTILKLTDSTISAGSGTALNLGMNQKLKYTVELNEGAYVLSDSGIGIYVDSKMVGPSWYDEENPTLTQQSVFVLAQLFLVLLQ